MRPKTVRFVAAVAVLGLLSFGCAGDGDVTVPEGPTDRPEATEASATPEESHEPVTKTFTEMAFDVELELDDFYFDPTTIKAPGGATATIELTNEGDTAHTFTVEGLDVDETVEAGESATVEIELGTETRYEYVCRFHAASQGMKGSFSLH